MLTDEVDKGKLFVKRISVLYFLELFCVLILISRIYYLQVIESEKYTMLANENRMNVRLIPPKRGIIKDRFGHELAKNIQNFRVLLIAEQAGSYLDSTLEDLSKLIKLSDNEIENIKKEVRQKRRFVPIKVKENLEWKDMVKVQMNLPDLPGIVIDEDLSRYYPYQSTTHVVGYVGPVLNEIKEDSDPVLDLPGFRIGKSGIESYFEKELRGVSGSRRVEVNSIGRMIREISRKEAQSGEDITLSIDLRLQEYISKVLSRHIGSAVVLDIKTGEVLAMVSEPTFDANLFNFGLSHENWDAIRKSPFSPMTNKAVSGLYPPGSTFKMLVGLSALETKVIDKNEEIDCKGYVNFNNHKLYCWKRMGHGLTNLYKAIKESCDVYFYEVALRTGIDNISKMARMFGLGKATGITLLSEKEGVIPDREWKLATEGSSWQKGDTINVGIGQGSVLVTPLQLAVMTARIASYGNKIEPTLIKDGNKGNKSINEKINVSRRNLMYIRDAMFAVVNEKKGSAFGSRLSFKELKMAGKTGTSQVKRLINRFQKISDIPYKHRDHALFVGYAPANKPKYAVAVVIEHGGGGSSVAAPIVQKIMEKTIELNPTNPNQKSIIN